MIKIYDISINGVISPSIIKTLDPRFGWKIESDVCGAMQESYIITVKCGEQVLLDSGRVHSSRSFDVYVEGISLPTRSELTVTVTVWDTKGQTATASISTATEILDDEWENAVWIKPKEHIIGWAPYLRTRFELGRVRSAVMYACGLGAAQYYVNGERTDNYYIDPPMTNYEKTLLYRRFDVTDMLVEGKNTLCIWLFEGYYSQSRVWGYNGFYYGDVCARLCLDVTLEDGSKKTIVTNTSDWEYKYSPITVNNIYGGETYDCRLEISDLHSPDASSSGWGEVIEDTTLKGSLEPCLMPPIREIRALPAKKVWCASGDGDGAWIFDMGENIAGIAEFHIPRSPRGAVYVFRYAEDITPSGQLDYRSSGAFATQCIQQDIYICRGDSTGEVYRPRSCYHGFRYIEITGFHDFKDGYGKMPEPDLCTAIQLSTDMRRTGHFSCSDGELTHLYNVMNNTFMSNFHGFPEDCPARERCGWLGDAQICCNFGLLTYDSLPSYKKYLNDIRDSREVYGVWQMVSPGKRGCGEATPLWGCAQVLIPYYIYKYCGDSGAVIDNFDLMQAWVKHEVDRADDFVISVGLGDWCTPETNDNPRRMPVPHSSTFMFYEICICMAEICDELGIGDKFYYDNLALNIKDSLVRHFYDSEKHTYGYWGSDGVALSIGAYPDGEREALLSSLISRIKNDEYSMPTAIYANKYLVPLLFGEGYGDIALRFLFNKEKKSFSTMLDNGATTLWETFEYPEPEQTDGLMRSLDHPMQGGFLYFCYTHIAGVRPTAPGFARFSFAPCRTRGIDSFEAEILAPTGKIYADGCRCESLWRYSLDIPVGSVCTLDIAGATHISVNGKAANTGDILGSGKYCIEVLIA